MSLRQLRKIQKTGAVSPLHSAFEANSFTNFYRSLILKKQVIYMCQVFNGYFVNYDFIWWLYIRAAKYWGLFKADRGRGRRHSIWLIPRIHQDRQDSGKARVRLFSLEEIKNELYKKYICLDRAIKLFGDVWSLPYRDNSLKYTENVQMSSKQEFSLGNRIKISEKTVTHDNAFFNEYFIK